MRNISEGTVFLRTAKTGTPVRCPVPQLVEDSVKAICKVNSEFPFFSGNCKVKSAVADWQRTLARLFKIAGIEDGYAHRFRDTAAVNWLSHGVSVEDVAILLGHQSIRVTEKHYAPFVKVRQDRLEGAVRRTFAA